ncbi:MAG: YgiT-type zinc finger protein [Desulfovibrio sp.]|nr:YgiT-type zinc finger protein [Desulfovibrio sp.]
MRVLAGSPIKFCPECGEKFLDS